MSRVFGATPGDGEQPAERTKSTLSIIMAPRSKNSHKLKALTQSHLAAHTNTARSSLKKPADDRTANPGAATQRYTTDTKAKTSTTAVFRELSLSTSAQKIQSSIENVSAAAVCDTARTAQAPRKDAAVERARAPVGSSNSSMVVYDRADEDGSAAQTAPPDPHDPAQLSQMSKTRMSSQLQNRLMLSIDRISRTPALKVPALAAQSQKLSARTPRESPGKKQPGQARDGRSSHRSGARNQLHLLLQPTPVKYRLTGASPMRTSALTQQHTTANSTQRLSARSNNNSFSNGQQTST